MSRKPDRDTCVHANLVLNRPIADRSPQLDRRELAEAMLLELVDQGEMPQ